ncbi:MAG: hypothetical protein J6Q13_00815 [Clostridia bacterium]|nr:hypothetical protein [Clostridia bacterium]
MKIKFNLKLTAFLVSLFISLLLLILGSKNTYCLSFGFMLLGASLGSFIWYMNEKIENELTELNQAIDELTSDENLDEDDGDEEIEEQGYILQQLYSRQKQLIKKKRKIKIVFGICGGALIILGFINLF